MEAVHLLTMKMNKIVHIMVDRVELHLGDQSHVVPVDPHPQPDPTSLRCASFQESVQVLNILIDYMCLGQHSPNLPVTGNSLIDR